MPAPPSFRSIVGKLAKHYGPPGPPPPKGPFELILWENVAYLADDERRGEAFALLKKRVGTSPGKILNASTSALRAVAAHGILAERFAGKLREVARIAMEEFDGDLDGVVAGPVAGARKALQRFPGIGGPGAEKILLFLRRHPSLAAESNGLRVLTRLGIIRGERSYAASYARAQKAAAEELGDDVDVLITAHSLLRRHGQTLCRRSAPTCSRCPLAPDCLYLADRSAPSSNQAKARLP
jgi:endonuclease III